MFDLVGFEMDPAVRFMPSLQSIDVLVNKKDLDHLIFMEQQDQLLLKVKKQAQFRTPDQAVFSLDPSNHAW